MPCGQHRDEGEIWYDHGTSTQPINISSPNNDIILMEPKIADCSSLCCKACICGCQDSAKSTEMELKSALRPLYNTAREMGTANASVGTFDSVDGGSSVEADDSGWVLTPSLATLSRSPANRTGEQIAREKMESFLKQEIDDKPFAHLISQPTTDEEVPNTEDVEVDDVFGQFEVSDSMEVQGDISSDNNASMLSSYSTLLSRDSISGSTLVFGAGAGMSDSGRWLQLTADCRHGCVNGTDGHNDNNNGDGCGGSR